MWHSSLAPTYGHECPGPRDRRDLKATVPFCTEDGQGRGAQRVSPSSALCCVGSEPGAGPRHAQSQVLAPRLGRLGRPVD